ncbi:MAG TPA: glycosyl hydrolase family 28-related protein, partial [Candidatus Saccharimonadales bacterium]
MSRLPSPGSDNGTWGQILNDFLSVEHNADGTLKLRNDGSLNSLFDAAGSADAARAAAIADAASKYQTKTFINVKDFGAKGDATANDTAAIQAAINYANSLTEGAHNQIVGGVVYFPSGFYITDTLTLLDNVYLHGGRIGNEGYRAAPAKLVPSSAVTGTSFMITQGASVRNAGIIGFSMYGQGGTTTTGCINLPNATNVVVSACYIDNWGAEALILGGGDCVLSYNNLTGLLNTGAVNSQRGAATISGGDHQISHNEFTGPSQYAVSSTNLYCAGALINTYSAEFDHCVFQTADVGCVISGGACNRFVGCRFDTNAGHGLMCSSGTSNIFAGCAWNRNSYSGAGNYDHINVPSGGGSLMYFDAPLMNNQSGPAVRYCINDQKSSATYHNTYLYPHGDLGVSGLSSLASSNASVIVNVPGASIISGVYLSQTLAANGAVTFNAASA